jgi:hypothetical protein
MGKLLTFLSTTENDQRITIYHIGIYASLVYFLEKKDYHKSVNISRKEIMKFTHLRSLPTYHKYLIPQTSAISFKYSFNFTWFQTGKASLCPR